jgi:hypothetical protein
MTPSVTPFDTSLPPPVNGAARNAAGASGGWTASVPPTRARRRWLIGGAAAAAALLCATWLATRTVPWFGPLLADSLRSLLGGEAVTKLEETVADVEDRVQHALSRGKVRTLSETTPHELLLSVDVAPSSAVATNKPADVGPLHAATAGTQDGVWQTAKVRSTSESLIHRTIIHPDPERAYAELFVFALDLAKVQVHAVAGSIEPKSPVPVRSLERPGIIPSRDRGRLVAAFNGGFKAEHGRFGMMVDGVQLLSPRVTSCTFASMGDGGLRIQPWSKLSNDASRLNWWRQTPGCMVEAGVIHPGLRSADSRNWGATLEGKTVIRRSAVGLSADGRTLFVGISNSTTARALATGMRHAGAVDVAQLDVNFSYPRFLFYREVAGGDELNAFGAVKGQLYERDEYLGRPSTRDFFYVTLAG